MHPLPFIALLDCLAAFTFLYLLFAFRDHRRRRGFPYPPGPPSLPIVGNLLEVQNGSPWTRYTDLSKKYGDVFCLRVFGQVVVVLNSLSAIEDLLEKRSEAYADRPKFPIFEILELDWRISIARKGVYWREGRKLLDRSLQRGATMLYRHMIEERTQIFLGKLLATPKDIRNHIELLQGGLVMSLIYGYDLKDNDDLTTVPKQANEMVARLVLPGAALVNHLPFLRHIPSWVPWFSYEPMARTGRKLSQWMKNEPIEFVKNAIREGTAVPSLAREHLQRIENLAAPERQLQEEIVNKTLASMSLAATHTTISSMHSLFLALVLYPETQKRAQAELDSVVTRDRLPTLDDRPHLPYIDALCKELMRWHMVTPIGIPHAPSEDAVYKDFFIPKGSMVIANAWAILHDPEMYPDPEVFKPERFLNDNGTVRDDPAIRLVFGAGKRICPARHFVDAILFIFASSVLSAFDVRKAKDGNGRGIPARSAAGVGTGSVVVHPEKLDCSILPRDQLAQDLIMANANVLS